MITTACFEIARGFCPKLASGSALIGGYDVVFIGTPNWFKSMAPPVLAFLRGHDSAEKIVIPFCTHGGSGAAPEQIAAWLAEIGLLP